MYNLNKNLAHKHSLVEILNTVRYVRIFQNLLREFSETSKLLQTAQNASQVCMLERDSKGFLF